MTTGKPNKTLLGLPSDLEAAVKKLKEDEAARAGQGATPPAAAATDLSKTQYGNPHGSAEVAWTYNSAPLPQPAKPAETRQELPPALQQNALNRTLIGMRPAPAPSGPAAGTAPYKPPAPAQHVMQPIVPMQVVQVRGREAAAPSHAPAQESRSVSRSPIVQQPAPSSSQPHSATAAPAQFVQESRGASHSHSPEAPVAPAQPSSGGGGVTDNFAGLRAREAEIAALRAREAEAAASVASAARSPTHTATVPAVEANARPGSGAASAPGPSTADSGKPMAVTRLAGFETGVLRDGSARDVSHAAPPMIDTMDAAPRLSLSQEQSGSTRTANRAGANAPKRWPALSLLGLAVVAFGGVIVLRAPQLLPPPLAALVTGTTAVQGATPPANVPLEPEPALDPDTRVPGVADSDAHEATAVHAATAAGDTAVAAVAAPASAGLTGVAAQLEKEAIDLVLANDYTAASKLYEQLRAQVPGRREYPIMIALLARAVAAATCGKPGQEPCATP